MNIFKKLFGNKKVELHNQVLIEQSSIIAEIAGRLAVLEDLFVASARLNKLPPGELAVESGDTEKNNEYVNKLMDPKLAELAREKK